MKILFVLLHPGFLRAYESTIAGLADDGHEIMLAFNNMERDDPAELEMAHRLVNIYPQVGIALAPERYGFWRKPFLALCATIDFLRYCDKRYDQAPALRERVGIKSGNRLAAFLASLPLLNRPGVARWAIGLLRFLIKRIPSARTVNQFILDTAPEVVMITPLVDFASKQEDYVKSCRSLNLPSILCVASWDNLTNKGLIRETPDRVVVWNDAQKTEAIDLHGVPAGRVVVTGAQSYDKWFVTRPSTARSAFLSGLGLDPDRPLILYLCSSTFIAGGQERGFVEDWLIGLRTSGNGGLSTANVLIRPHPQNAAQWHDFAPLASTALNPRAGANPITPESESLFFDSLFHADAVVGINTSGMIEAGILAKPVLTILDSRFRHTQTGTLHFHHLVREGLVDTDTDFPAHFDRLARYLTGSDEWLARNRSFVRSFVRPHGLDVTATSHIIRAIVDLGRGGRP